MATLIAQLENVPALLSSVWGMMTANPLLLFMTSMVLLSVGVGVFRMIKRATRH